MLVTECRHCRSVLHKRSASSEAFVPGTTDNAKRNYYGGWVCSRECDYKACIAMEVSWGARRQSCCPNKPAMERIEFNWGARRDDGKAE